MWAWQMRKLDACTSHHREVRDRAQSAHGAKIFPSAGITEAQDYRCAAFDEWSFPGTKYPLHKKSQSRYVCGG